MNLVSLWMVNCSTEPMELSCSYIFSWIKWETNHTGWESTPKITWSGRQCWVTSSPISTNSALMNRGSSCASSNLVRILPFLPLTRWCTLPRTGSPLLRGSANADPCASVFPCDDVSGFPLCPWSRLRCLSCICDTMYGLCKGSAGPEMSDLVHPISVKNSSRIGTQRLVTFSFLLAWIGALSDSFLKLPHL